jgi:hypothetical protein
VHRLRGCDPFVLAHQVEQVYYMVYPCEKLSVSWVVYKVNPREWLHTPNDSGYHENQVPAREVHEFYQDDELLCSFHIVLDSTLNSLLGDANDIKHSLYFILYSLYFKLCYLYFILHSCYILLQSLYSSHTIFFMNTHLCLF